MELISVLFKIVQFFKARKKNQAVILSLVLALFKKEKKKCSMPTLKKSFIVMYIQIHAVPIRIIQGFVVVC